MTFYRYTDPFGNGKILERTFHLIKETQCGYWIADNMMHGNRHWVSKTARKRFAYPTRNLAWNSYRARKERQVALLDFQLRRARQLLHEAQTTEYEVSSPIYMFESDMLSI